jgi:hypothetical protein
VSSGFRISQVTFFFPLHCSICISLAFFAVFILRPSFRCPPTYLSKHVMLPAESPPDDSSNELDALPAFDAHTWIGTGKIFSVSEIPLHVLQEKYNQLEIPDNHLVHFPAVDLPVTQFTSLLLPTQSTEIITTVAKIWFSKDEPCTDVTCLLARPIPPKDFLAALGKSFGQSWLDGSRSISDHN